MAAICRWCRYCWKELAEPPAQCPECKRIAKWWRNETTLALSYNDRRFLASLRIKSE